MGLRYKYFSNKKVSPRAPTDCHDRACQGSEMTGTTFEYYVLGRGGTWLLCMLMFRPFMFIHTIYLAAPQSASWTRIMMEYWQVSQNVLYTRRTLRQLPHVHYVKDIKNFNPACFPAGCRDICLQCLLCSLGSECNGHLVVQRLEFSNFVIDLHSYSLFTICGGLRSLIPPNKEAR